ncbi:MAG: transposase [Planctomycetes bacterium]|nr:transposase [Planctomycetota bacterium]
MLGVSKLVGELKKGASSWIKSEFPSLGAFYWQHGCAACSISPSQRAGLKEYIRNQVDHYHGETFPEDSRRLLQK